MDNTQANKKRAVSKAPVLPTPEQEASAKQDKPVLADGVAQALEDCILFHIEYGECDEVNLSHVATFLRATHRWHIERANGLASGVAA